MPFYASVQKKIQGHRPRSYVEKKSLVKKFIGAILKNLVLYEYIKNDDINDANLFLNLVEA